MAKRARDLAFLKEALPLTHASKLAPDELGAEWWDHSVLDPQSKAEPSGDLKHTLKNLPLSVKRDIAQDSANPQQILPPEYRYVNDTINHMRDLQSLSDEKDDMPHDSIDLVLQATSNFMKEKMKYENVYPEKKKPQNVVIVGDRRDGWLADLADDDMAVDYRFGD